ncbi:hypothetical protein LBMAG53_04490 [Planctomycetota bacterium]|nr:hypothetical protein LBMAG53_04490 [Planctomycetota bacterium]
MHPTRRINDYELILVTRGDLHLWEEETRYDLAPGDYLILRPGHEHRASANYGRSTAFIWVHFGFRTGRSLVLARQGRAARPARAEELARRLLDEHERTGSPDLLKDLHLAVLCAELALATPEPGEGRDEVADRAWRLLVLRFAERLSTADIAAALSCHPDHLTRAYRRRFGHPPLEGLHRRRIAHARKLLNELTASQEDVAAACGYSDVRHFRRWFRRLSGVTPGMWRRINGRAHMNTE